MNEAQWWIFLPACIGMNFFPGPNNLIALIHGTRTSLFAASVAGLARLPVMVVMLVLLAYGLEALLALSEHAFFPQFMDPTANIANQVTIMGGTFIVIEIGAIIAYASGGRWLQKKLSDESNTKWLARFTATALTAAAGLVLLP